MKKGKKFLNYIIIIIMLIITTWICIEKYKELKIQDKQSIDIEYNTQNVKSEVKKEENLVKQEETSTTKKEYEKEKIIDKYKGYKVSAKLNIPKINLETYILQEYSTSALNVSVTKFWGADANNIGNFCVAGHNFKNKNMFRNLKKLEQGDTLSIADNKVGKIKYKIYSIYTVNPEDVSCLSQKTKGNREVTLITCTNDSKKRVIVKAIEDNENIIQ